MLEFGLSYMGWFVGPLLGDGVGEDVGSGLVGFGGDVGVVRMSSSGEWCVDGGVVGGGVD